MFRKKGKRAATIQHQGDDLCGDLPRKKRPVAIITQWGKGRNVEPGTPPGPRSKVKNCAAQGALDSAHVEGARGTGFKRGLKIEGQGLSKGGRRTPRSWVLKRPRRRKLGVKGKKTMDVWVAVLTQGKWHVERGITRLEGVHHNRSIRRKGSVAGKRSGKKTQKKVEEALPTTT